MQNRAHFFENAKYTMQFVDNAKYRIYLLKRGTPFQLVEQFAGIFSQGEFVPRSRCYEFQEISMIKGEVYINGELNVFGTADEVEELSGPEEAATATSS